MADEISIEMVNRPIRRSFWRTGKGIMTFIFICIAALAGLFSWWLADGKISSVAATLDTMVYTVEPESSGKITKLYVNSGEIVNQGQPLGNLQISSFASAPQLDNNINSRLSAAQQTEQQMAAKVAQVRDQEMRVKKIYDDSVTDHARAQLHMRSINVADRHRYEQATATVNAARKNMDTARDAFEEISKSRAVMEIELNKIRAELQRARMGNRSTLRPATAPAAPVVVSNDLFSPVSGRVMRINAIPGQEVQKGEPLFLIMPIGKANSADSWIEAWFPQDAYKKIKVGQKVQIKFANKDMITYGKVVAIADEAQMMRQKENMKTAAQYDKSRFNATNYLPVRIVLDDPAEAAAFQPGTKAQCQIQTRYIFGLF